MLALDNLIYSMLASCLFGSSIVIGLLQIGEPLVAADDHHLHEANLYQVA